MGTLTVQANMLVANLDGEGGLCLHIIDDYGQETSLLEHGVIKYKCEECTAEWFQESRTARYCPGCAYPHIEHQWMRPQVALIPEEESRTGHAPQ